MNRATWWRDAVHWLEVCGLGTATEELELYAMHFWECTRSQVSGQLERQPGAQAVVEHFVQRRTQGEPLQYIVGWTDFCDQPFQVDRRALIPRPETETLVEAVLEVGGHASTTFRVVDVGTGTGVVITTLALQRSQWRLAASDYSRAAIDLARTNARRHGVEGRIEWVVGDLLSWFRGSPAGADVVVANLPYVSSEDIVGLARELHWEPPGALDGGVDGLLPSRALLDQAAACLSPGGWCVLELDISQVKILRQEAERTDVWQATRVWNDFTNRPRVLGVQRSR